MTSEARWQEASTLTAPLFAVMDQTGRHTAVLTFQRQGAARLSHQELATDARRIGGGLRLAGIGAGDRVALLAEPGPEWITVVLGAMVIGAVPMPLDTQMPQRELQSVLDDGAPAVLFTTGRHAEELRELLPEVRLWLLDAPEREEASWRRLLAKPVTPAGGDPEDVAALFYTSGTTGPPKGVPLSQRNLAFQLDAIERAGIALAGDRLLLPLPLHHVYPFVLGLLAPLALGLTVVLPRAVTGPQLVRALQEGEVSLIVGVPRLYRALYDGIEGRLRGFAGIPKALFRALVKLSAAIFLTTGWHVGGLLFAPVRRRIAPRLRLVASGGAPLDSALALRLEALGWPVVVGYGLTETSPLLTLRPAGSRALDSVGPAVPGVSLRIDPERAPEGLRQHGRGEVLARGPNVFAGYRNQPEKTAQAFADGWFRTGDLGFLDRNGNLALAGRASSVIVTEGGENIQPDQVEEAFTGHPLIAEAALLQTEAGLALLIVPDAAELRRSSEDEERAVRDAVTAVARHLPSYQRPGAVVLTRRPLERTRLGKLRRHRLAARLEEARSGEEEQRRPLAPEQWSSADREVLNSAAAATAWRWLAERYPERGLSPDSSPQLDLGVDSMEWLNLTMALVQQTGVELEEEAIAEVETVRDLLGAVAEAAEGGGGGVSLTALLREPERALDKQQRRWLRPQGPSTRLFAEFLAALDVALVRRAFRLRAEGLEHVPDDRPVMFTPNHVSFLDPFVVAAALGRRRLRGVWWGGWTGVAFSNPLLRAGSRAARAVPVDPERGVMSSLALAAGVLNAGRSLVWFPEGGRAPDGRFQPFRPGVGLLLKDRELPVVPVAVRGTFEALPPGRVWPRRHPVTVTFGKPLWPEQLAREGEGEAPEQRIVSALHDRLGRLLEG